MIAFVTRALIALLVLFTQSTIGAVVNDCVSGSVPKPFQKSVAKCPMGMKTCCVCCPTQAKSKPSSQSKCPTKCIAKAQTSQSPVALRTVSEIQTVGILVDQETLNFSRQVGGSPSEPQHLAIPRIRPPDPRQHGLRAPPSR